MAARRKTRKQTIRVTLYMTEAHRGKLEAMADTRGISLSAWIVSTCLALASEAEATAPR